MKHGFLSKVVLAALFVSSSVFAVDSKTCHLSRVVDPEHVAATSSELVKSLLEKKGYKVVDITHEETAGLLEDTFWGFFQFSSASKKKIVYTKNTCVGAVHLYHVKEAATSKSPGNVIFYANIKEERMGKHAEDICVARIKAELEALPECNKME